MSSLSLFAVNENCSSSATIIFSTMRRMESGSEVKIDT